MNLSVLMSIYYKEKAEYFHKTMESIWTDQTLRPDEIILVEDGVLSDHLYSAINYWKEKIGTKLVSVPLPKNMGLALALNEGLKVAKGNFIARMDTDDIAERDRFKVQLEFLQQHVDVDAVGCWICEIDENDSVINDKVEYPLLHNELYQFFEKRDPIAHPTAMFRKAFFDKAGRYSKEVALAEDTLLWYQAFLNNCRLANVDYIGLKFRRSSDFYKRRANWKKTIGLLKFRLFHINRDLNYGIKADIYAIAYFLMSISPSFVKKLLYKLFR